MSKYRKSNFDLFKSSNRYQRKFSYDIDGDVLSARKLRKNSLTGRSAALDIVLHSNIPVLQENDKNSFTNKTRKKQRLKKARQQSDKNNFEIDPNVLKDFEDLYEEAKRNNNPASESSPIEASPSYSASQNQFNENYDNNIISNEALEHFTNDSNGLLIEESFNDVNGNFTPVNNEFSLTKSESHSLEASEQDIVINKKYSLYRYNIIPDGNCLYRAISQAVYTDDEYHLVLRQATINYIEKNIDDFKFIIEPPVDEFLKIAKHEGEWAGYPEILAMTKLLNVNINITTGGSFENPNVQTTCHYYYPESDTENSNKKLIRQKSTTRPTVWLSWLSSGHYDLLSDEKIENQKYKKYCQKVAKQNELDASLALKISNEISPMNVARKLTNENRTSSKTKLRKKIPINEYEFSSTASLQSLTESCANSDFSSAFDMDNFRNSDLYA